MRRWALVLTVLLLAGTAGAVETVLTRDSVLYTIEAVDAQPQLEIVRRSAGVRDVLVVPGTEDEALEADARLAFDQQSGTLFVAWRHVADEEQLLLASVDASGTWSEPVVVAGGGVRRGGLNLALTRFEDTTLLHAAWWDLGCEGATPQYALVAFEQGVHVSTQVENLDVLAAMREAAAFEMDDTSSAAYPPMAIARAEDGVDVVFGAVGTTAVTRVRISPKLEPLARIWRPVGKSGGRLPSAKLASTTAEPVRAFISKGRVVLYTPDAQFRFVVFENGRWSPARMIQLDESLSPDTLVYELRRTVDEQAGADDDIVTH